MKRLFLVVSLASLVTLTSCGKNSAPAQAASAAQADEECPSGGCTEQSLNAPVGPQPAPEPKVSYDSVPSNPHRSTLRFPEFDARWGLTKHIYDKASAYFEANKDSIENPRYFTIVDFNLRSSQKRLFLFDLSNGTVEKHAVAHGKNSDNGSGYATKFSNKDGSEQSSLGFYRTLGTYIGKHGLSLQLAGLSATDSNVEARAIVMHPADYVSDAVPKAGRSWGCPAIDPHVSASVIARLKNGSILLVDR